MKFFDESHRRSSVRGLADDLKIAFEFEHSAKALAHDYVVVGQQDSDSLHELLSLFAGRDLGEEGRAMASRGLT